MAKIDGDEAVSKLREFVRGQAATHMPHYVDLEVIDGSLQFETGYVTARHAGRTVRCIAPGPLDLTAATEAAPHIIKAWPPNPNNPGALYIAIGLAMNGTDGSRVPQVTATSYTDEGGVVVTDHGNLSGNTDDDHAQYMLEDGSRAASGKFDLSSGGLLTKVTTDDVSNLPTDSELDSAFGTPAAVGAGFIGLVDDAGSGAAVWLVASDGTNWWHSEYIKAVDPSGGGNAFGLLLAITQ